MIKIRKNDTVAVLAGKDKGKTGKVLAVISAKNRAIVEGINFVKRHTRKTGQDKQGGVIQKEAAINISNLALFCKRCNRSAKVGVSVLQDETKSRFCKKCNEVF